MEDDFFGAFVLMGLIFAIWIGLVIWFIYLIDEKRQKSKSEKNFSTTQFNDLKDKE